MIVRAHQGQNFWIIRYTQPTENFQIQIRAGPWTLEEYLCNIKQKELWKIPKNEQRTEAARTYMYVVLAIFTT